jgi:ubiquinone/menaquinone biosynthesis C-methylase UbiE
LNVLPPSLIKFGFKLLYNQLAWSYDIVAWSVSFGQWSAWRRLALLFLQPGPSLELAYGTGGFFVDMLDAGCQPYGIDLSPYMARLAGRRLLRRETPLRLSRSKAQALPFPSNSFTNVVATFPTNYIFDDATLAEVRRVLRHPSVADKHPGGRLIIVAEGKLKGPWPIRPFVDWLYKVTDQHEFPRVSPLHLFEHHDFMARWEIAEHEGATARLLIAEAT